MVIYTLVLVSNSLKQEAWKLNATLSHVVSSRPAWTISDLVSNKQVTGEGKLARWVKAPAAKPDDLSFIPGTHMVGGENQLLKVVLWPYTKAFPVHMHVRTHAHTPFRLGRAEPEDLQFWGWPRGW